MLVRRRRSIQARLRGGSARTASGRPSIRFGSGRDRLPDVERRRRGDAVHAGPEVEQVVSSWKCRCGGQLPFSGYGPIRRELVAAGDGPAGLQAGQRVAAQVAVQRPERHAVVGLVAQDGHRPEVVGRGALRAGLDDAVERGPHDLPGGQEQVDGRRARCAGRRRPSASKAAPA